MNQHPFGEKILDRNRPPGRATGLIIRQFIYKADYVPITNFFRHLAGYAEAEPRYFVINGHTGSYDYGSGVNTTCSSYYADMGYHHYATEEERDAQYEKMIKAGYIPYEHR